MTLTLTDLATSTGTSEKGRAWVLVPSMLAWSMLAGTTTSGALPIASTTVVASGTGTGGFSLDDEPVPNPAARAIQRLHDRSGLAWDQVARLFGVSRRAVHKWASGGAMNGHHAARLAELTQMLGQMGGTPTEVRASLLAPDERGRTPFQRLIVGSNITPDRPEGFRPEQLLGGRRTGDVTVMGEIVDDEPIEWPNDPM